MYTSEKYVFTKKLGAGMSAEVYLTQDNKAVKVFDLSNEAEKDRTLMLYNGEAEAIRNMNWNNKNVMKFMECEENVMLTDNNGNERLVNLIVMEAVNGGDFIDVILESPKLTEPIARYFFIQLL